MRRHRGSGALLALLAPLLLVLGAPAQAVSDSPSSSPSSTASPSPSADPDGDTGVDGDTGEDGEATATLTIEDLRPRAPRPGDPFQVIASLRNTGTTPLRDVSVRLARGSRLDSRSSLTFADNNPDLAYTRVQTFPVALQDDVLGPGDEVRFDLRTTVDALDLGRTGVYPLRIRASGSGDGGEETVLDEARTYVPWFVDETVNRLRIAWVVPLVDQPRMGPDEAFVDDTLPALLDPQGRLGSLVEGTKQNPVCRAPEPVVADGETAPIAAPAERRTCTRTPVTFAVDPDLLYGASALTQESWRVRGSNGALSAAKPPSAAAGRFLSTLKAAVSGPDDVLALPFADPDVVALTNTTSTLGGQLPVARALGTGLTETLVGSPLTSVALAPPGPVSTRALDALSADDAVQAVVLDRTALQDPDAPSTLSDRTGTPPPTPGTRAQLSASPKDLTGLVVDEGLSTLLTQTGLGDDGTGVSATSDTRLLEQRWLVETAMIAAEAPGAGRTLLVEVPRRDAVDPVRLRSALADTGRLPWMCGVTLAAVVAQDERCPAPAAETQAGGQGDGQGDGQTDDQGDVAPQVVDRQPDRDGTLVTDPPDDLGDSLTPLTDAVVANVATLKGRSEQLTTAILAGDDDAAARARSTYQRSVLRSLSTAWRTDPSAGRRLTNRLRDTLSAQINGVVLRAGRILLTSKNSRLQVSIDNNLAQDIQVSVRINGGQADGRIVVDEPGPVLVRAGRTVPVNISAETLSSGRFVVNAQLYDRDGQPFGAARQLQINSTRYGTLALAVTGIATAILLVAAGVRLTRRAIRAGRRRSRTA